MFDVNTVGKRPFLSLAMCEKCPYLELFSPVFSRIPTEYVDIPCGENTDQNNSKYGHFLCSTNWRNSTVITIYQTCHLLSLTHILEAVAVVSHNPSNSLVSFCLILWKWQTTTTTTATTTRIEVNVFPYRHSDKQHNPVSYWVMFSGGNSNS